MKKIRLTKVAQITGCLFVFTILLGSLVFVNSSFKEENVEKDYEYVGNVSLDDIVKPVVSTYSSTLLIRPYLDTKVKVIKDFYDYQSTEEKQIDSIVYYESTYMPNFAVAYGGTDSDFDVISILDGTVVSVKEDGLLGNIIEIQHENGLISVYQSVSKIKVEANQVVKQGDVIASSGNSNINKDLKSHLLFELLIDGNIVNPEEYYNKDIIQ